MAPRVGKPNLFNLRQRWAIINKLKAIVNALALAAGTSGLRARRSWMVAKLVPHGVAGTQRVFQVPVGDLQHRTSLGSWFGWELEARAKKWLCGPLMRHWIYLYLGKIPPRKRRRFAGFGARLAYRIPCSCCV